MTVEGSGQIIRNPDAGSGCVVFIDDLYWDTGASSTFTITVEAGVTLLIGAWWQPLAEDDAPNVTIDAGVEGTGDIDPVVDSFGSATIFWPAMFWAVQEDLSPGSHTVGFTLNNGGGDITGTYGGLAVFHVLATCYTEQVHTL